MSCPNCGHTMQSIMEPVGIIHWCPRCGSVKTKGGTLYETPKLVERCREFEKYCAEAHGWMQTNVHQQWFSLGIPESIHVPGDRLEDGNG
jgi:Zn-finger nucleic acid-binding protein